MRFVSKLFALGAFALISASMSLAPATAKDLKIGVVNLSLCCAYFVGMSEHAHVLRPYRFDVLVQAEEVRRIVLPL